ncbi:AAA family ATPase [Variovorax sp. J22R115]|uniref:AAA family ATPase n=1 Tax=Variovorax sp. J22R115 TaxID=3053509 RepID=UPI0025775CD8|nr:AAA family ATPase [Variovorax sp. J22R115]MDM0048872.1 AAA family ATPase [Variovorax sp. J22R115]
MAQIINHVAQKFAFVVAKLRKLRGRFANNVLVRALPPLPKPEALKQRLQVLPKFSVATRKLSAHERRLRLRALSRFFLALPNVCELAEFIYSEICEGYVGREPNSPAANRRMQSEYLRGRVERTTSDGGLAHNLCSALIGIPGAGKTFAIRQIARLFPPIIYHEEFNLWQIPLLFVQTPYKNNTGENLARAIIAAIARLYPPGDYVKLYLEGGYSELALVGVAKRLLECHRVGILIVDEAQKSGAPPIEDYDGGQIGVSKPSKGTEKWAAGILFEASTDMSVPLLLVATSDIEVALGRRLATLRRQFGNGLPHWDPLDVLVVDGQPSDYDLYMNALWRYMLLRQPPEYSVAFRNVFHYYTFGIPDFILKLFYVVQWRALQAGKETFTVADVHRM